MGDYLKSRFIEEEKNKIKDIPIIRFYPKATLGLYPTIILYHGWSSSKESQRMRGFILSSLGYQVIIPDAINHGERGTVDYTNPEVAMEYFWPTILKNLGEAKDILDYAIDNYSANPNRLGVIGNSMGGFTSAGIFAHNPNIKAAVIFNGSCNWEHSNLIFKEVLEIEDDSSLEEMEVEINSMDPINNLDAIVNRPVLMLHGDADTLVNIESQRLFYNKVKPLYNDSNKIKLIEYNNLNHFVTTNMMEEAAIWFGKYL